MVVLGKIVDPYGVRGWVRVHPFADDPQSWGRMASWWLGCEGQNDWREVKVRASRIHSGELLCQLEGVADRTAAEAMVGWLVAAPREALPATAKDEYYWADLIGLHVVNTAEVSLGRVEGLIETGANDVLRVVDAAGVERLLPFVGQVVLAVEKENGVVRVDWELDW